MVIEYTSELKITWIEIDHYRLVTNLDYDEHIYILKDNLYQFLYNLNSHFINWVGQLLNRKIIPTFEGAKKIIWSEESKLILLSEN